MQVLSIGEVLWDVFPNGELLGGAPLNFAANAVRLGHAAALVSALGRDERGRRARHAIAALGVDGRFIQEVASADTGRAIVSTTANGEPAFEIPRPAAFDLLDLPPELLETARELRPDWLYFGTLIQMEPRIEALVRKLRDAVSGVRTFYDMNLRRGGWDLPLVQRLCAMASILKLNESEAQILGQLSGMNPEKFSLKGFSEAWASQYHIEAVCVTLGPAGCLVFENGTSHMVPGYPTTVHDTVGAGDAFAAAFLHGYEQRWPIERTARFANAVGSIVASHPGATPPWSVEEAFQLASISSAHRITDQMRF